MPAMTTAILTEAAKPTSTLAVQLNLHLETQPKERTLDRLDLCDRCCAAAQSSFVFTIPDLTSTEPGATMETDILLCGHHTRQHLPALLAKNPASYWVEPKELHTIRGVKITGKGSAQSGDGLTDA